MANRRKKTEKDSEKFKKTLGKLINVDIVEPVHAILTDKKIAQRISWSRGNIESLTTSPEGCGVVKLWDLDAKEFFVLKYSLSTSDRTIGHFARYNEIIGGVSRKTNVIQPYMLSDIGGYVTLAGFPCILMELGEHSLLKFRTEKKQFGIVELCDTALAMCSGLEAVYDETGFLHRDFKSSNVIFVGGVPKVADFEHAEIEGATTTGIKSRPYRAPELDEYDGREEERIYTPQTDVFALGATLYEMVALECLFLDGRNRDNLEWINEKIDKKITDRSLNAIIRGCVYHSRSKEGRIVADGRYKTVTDVRKDIEVARQKQELDAYVQALEGLGVPATVEDAHALMDARDAFYAALGEQNPAERVQQSRILAHSDYAPEAVFGKKIMEHIELVAQVIRAFESKKEHDYDKESALKQLFNNGPLKRFNAIEVDDASAKKPHIIPEGIPLY